VLLLKKLHVRENETLPLKLQKEVRPQGEESALLVRRKGGAKRKAPKRKGGAKKRGGGGKKRGGGGKKRGGGGGKKKGGAKKRKR